MLNQQSPALTAERWNPILHYISAQSGVPLQLRMGPTVQETDAMMGRGEFDFMFTNHNFQSEFDSVGYRVIARWGGDPIHGVIAVLADSPIESLKQLDGEARGLSLHRCVRGVRRADGGAEARRRDRGQGVRGQPGGRAGPAQGAAGGRGGRQLALPRQYAERENMRVREIFVSEGFPDLAVIVDPRVPGTPWPRCARHSSA